MYAYIVRRLLLMIPTIIIVSLIIFISIRLVPGDTIDIMAASQSGFLTITRTMLEQKMGLDVPIVVQYGRWIGFLRDINGNFNGMLQGNLGRSLWSNATVISQIKDRWPITLQLGILGIICGQLFALPVGILSAIRQDTWGDYLGRSFAIICMAVPGFWVGTMILVFPSIWWGYMPPISYVSFFVDPVANLKMLLPAAVVLGMAMTGTTMRMTRAMMLEVLRADYVRTAWSKGLRERAVIVRHALKNALIPVITLVGLWLGVLIGGTVIIEQVFSLPGLGRLIVDAALSRDYPVISGVLLFFGCGMIFINLLVDLTYAYLDPRIRYQ